MRLWNVCDVAAAPRTKNTNCSRSLLFVCQVSLQFPRSKQFWNHHLKYSCGNFRATASQAFPSYMRDSRNCISLLKLCMVFISTHYSTVHSPRDVFQHNQLLDKQLENNLRICKPIAADNSSRLSSSGDLL